MNAQNGEAHKRVVLLLETLSDVLPAARVAQLDASFAHGAPGSLLLRLDPDFRRGSYAELERRLRDLREAERPLYRAVSGRYLEAERRVLQLPVLRGRWGGRVVYPERCEPVGTGAPAITGRTALVVCRIWRYGVDEDAASEGVGWLARRMYRGRSDRIVVPVGLVA